MPTLISACDGVLADTERFERRPALDATAEHFGQPVRWGGKEHGEKLQIGGGTERLEPPIFEPELVTTEGLSTDDAGRRTTLFEWHRYKTEVHRGIVASGRLQVRLGVVRLVREASGAGWRLAVASTSAAHSVRSVLDHVFGAEWARECSSSLVMKSPTSLASRSTPSSCEALGVRGRKRS